MGEKGHNTNLAAEFYVLSILYRLGINAHLTLGNKKFVDLVVEKEDKVITIDVKGLKDTSCFPIDNWNKKNENHFLIFVSFLKRIDDPNIIPDVFILPSLELENRHKELEGKSIIYKNPKGNRVVVEYNRLKKLGAKYKNKWEYFL